MRNRPVVITELPPSPEQEQSARMRRYALTMGIRVLCVIACLFVQGWWLLIPALGAVFLPYVAVVFANAVSRGGGRTVERPGAIEPRDPA
ncbi:DUF3099 domain-containing protein [Pseudolysinimonas sp.]|uniref:DUF3099 domain-containing protein n=1 Tax=Pseudolysinimonas sp. TaxID=2680009 RepID=UPI00286B5EB8|nr:DUF3099 domain-containing protein [Pseudolysinimonas sp.]